MTSAIQLNYRHKNCQYKHEMKGGTWQKYTNLSYKYLKQEWTIEEVQLLQGRFHIYGSSYKYVVDT